mmetsp:Transcript_98752/g.318502  ORF Transcript_98752/g.318502 Transcript_98752/m.318502 type:complete len:238 (-) Transcript_98752:88-801(-)
MVMVAVSSTMSFVSRTLRHFVTVCVSTLPVSLQETFRSLRCVAVSTFEPSARCCTCRCRFSVSTTLPACGEACSCPAAPRATSALACSFAPLLPPSPRPGLLLGVAASLAAPVESCTSPTSGESASSARRPAVASAGKTQPPNSFLQVPPRPLRSSLTGKVSPSTREPWGQGCTVSLTRALSSTCLTCGEARRAATSSDRPSAGKTQPLRGASHLPPLLFSSSLAAKVSPVTTRPHW